MEENTVKFDSSKSTNMALNVDSVLKHIRQLGPFQIRILVMFLFITIPSTYPTLIMIFLAYEPPWMCAQQSLSCLESNSSSAGSAVYSTATKPSQLYERRCSMNRSDWKFADYNLYEGPHQTIVDEVKHSFVLKSKNIFLLVNAIFSKTGEITMQDHFIISNDGRLDANKRLL